MTDRGCFGLPSVYNAQANACARCRVQAACRERVLGTLNRVRGALPVQGLIDAIELQYTGSKLSLDQVQLVASAPRKIAGRLENLFLKGFDRVARERLQRGENPFPPNGAKHLHIAGEFLLRREFTKAEYRAECQARLKWPTATAMSECSNALALLRCLKLVRDTGAKIESTY